jgi:transcription elongation factor Elf1
MLHASYNSLIHNMGYSDKLEVTITCPECNVSEERVAKDYGSVYAGPAWEKLDSFTNFVAPDDHSEKHGPRIRSATCKKCGVSAKVENRYTQ